MFCALNNVGAGALDELLKQRQFQNEFTLKRIYVLIISFVSFSFQVLLSHIFELYQRQSQIPKLDILQCIPLIVRQGTKYQFLVSDLHQYLPNVIRIVKDGQFENQLNSQKQILLIVYELIRNVSISLSTYLL